MILNNKTIAILAFVHVLLEESILQKELGNSKTIIKTTEVQDRCTEVGYLMLNFCKDTRSTVAGIEDRLILGAGANQRLNLLNTDLIPLYKVCTSYYDDKIEVGVPHIPVIFCLEVFRILSREKMININASKFQEILALIQVEDSLNKDKRVSKFNKDVMITDRSEYNKYLLYASEILQKLWAADKQMKNALKLARKKPKKKKSKRAA